MTLVEFLLARIAEDERYATHAAGMMMGVEAGANGIAHINRWRPSRVLAECEAKRRIVEGIRDAIAGPVTEYYIGPTMTTDDVLTLLALPYAEHPDYAALNVSA